MVETREITPDPMIHPAIQIHYWWVSQSILPGRNGFSLSSTQQRLTTTSCEFAFL